MATVLGAPHPLEKRVGMRMTLEDGVRRGVGPRSFVLLARVPGAIKNNNRGISSNFSSNDCGISSNFVSKLSDHSLSGF